MIAPPVEKGPRPHGRWTAIALVAAGLVAATAPAAAAAQAPPPLNVPVFGQFRSVLAQGEGQSITAADLAAYQASGQPPDSFVNQQPLYVGIMPHANSLTPADLNTYYKNTNFGSMPGGTASVKTPHAGVQIYRDAAYGTAHIYGDNRYALMFGAGYATAEERLFLMDAIRRTAKGTLAGLLGPSAAAGDAQQLTDQDFSNQELTAQFNKLDDRFGAAGERTQADILAYVDGINARIDEVKANPNEMPAEYAALGATPQRWTVSDTAAMAVLLVTQFTVSNGGEEVNAQLQQAFRQRFGSAWRAPYRDLREAEDPKAYVVAKRPFLSDRAGPVKPGLNAIPAFGSITPRNAQVEGPSAQEQAEARASLPDWAQSVEGLKPSLPTEESNAVMVGANLSSDGHALAAMGPQVDYYSPQIFVEYELHGGGIDSSGVSFPGASPWPLIGHGIDFAWSGTSANGDNQDTFVERLCNPNGSPPTRNSTHYVYRGRCRAFLMRDQTVTTPVSPIDPQPPQQITYRTMRSVHGPVFAFSRVNGRPVALTKAKAVDFHELNAAVPFMRLSENRARDPRSFMQIMGQFPGTENWFYVGHRHIAWIQSGRYPLHAPGTDVDLPFWGDGRADWRNFNPQQYTFRAVPASHRPRAVNPDDGFIISWNNKEAIGWRKGPTEWSNGPVHRAMILEKRLFDQVRRQGGKVNLTGLTRAANLAATTDLRSEDVYPWMRRVIGTVGGRNGQLVQILNAWRAGGSKRLDANGDNVYEHSGAVALMDAWWPRFVTGSFRPALGTTLFELVRDRVLGFGDFGWDWGTQVQKDLRSVLGRPEQGRYSRIYCGGPRPHPSSAAGFRQARAACRKVLLSTLTAAYNEVAAKQGSANPSQWNVFATCDDPSTCDEIVPNTAGAVDTPPFPWQNRGTFHQIEEIFGHR
jgi:acyl-homoserine lactone acylase PvdQ